MASYTDLEQIEKLYTEQAWIKQGLVILEDHNGTVPSFTVAPVGAGPPTVVAVMITTTDPGRQLIAAAHANMVQRFNDINQELRDLGVTDTPPSQAGPKDAL